MNDKDRLTEILTKNRTVDDFKTEILKIVPELIICTSCTQKHPAHIYNVYDHIIKVVNVVHCDIVIRLTALLHDIGKPYKKTTDKDGIEHFKGHEAASAVLARYILTRLEFNEEIINKVCKLIFYHDYRIECTEEDLRRIVNYVGPDLIDYLFEHQVADLLGHSPAYIRKKMDNITQAQHLLNKSRIIMTTKWSNCL